jgi:hypothetical protein
MPANSLAQKKLMDAVKHNAAFARKVGIPQSVGRDFVAADRKAGLNKTHAGKAVPHPSLYTLPKRKT